MWGYSPQYEEEWGLTPPPWSYPVWGRPAPPPPRYLPARYPVYSRRHQVNTLISIVAGCYSYVMCRPGCPRVPCSCTVLPQPITMRSSDPTQPCCPPRRNWCGHALLAAPRARATQAGATATTTRAGRAFSPPPPPPLTTHFITRPVSQAGNVNNYTP